MSGEKCQTGEQSNFHGHHTESMHFAGKICNEAFLRYTYGLNTYRYSFSEKKKSLSDLFRSFCKFDLTFQGLPLSKQPESVQ